MSEVGDRVWERAMRASLRQDRRYQDPASLELRMQALIAQRLTRVVSSREEILASLRTLSVEDRRWVLQCLAADDYEAQLATEQK